MPPGGLRHVDADTEAAQFGGQPPKRPPDEPVEEPCDGGVAQMRGRESRPCVELI
jgi:hypothetical protein